MNKEYTNMKDALSLLLRWQMDHPEVGLIPPRAWVDLEIRIRDYVVAQSTFGRSPNNADSGAKTEAS